MPGRGFLFQFFAFLRKKRAIPAAKTQDQNATTSATAETNPVGEQPAIKEQTTIRNTTAVMQTSPTKEPITDKSSQHSIGSVDKKAETPITSTQNPNTQASQSWSKEQPDTSVFAAETFVTDITSLWTNAVREFCDTTNQDAVDFGPSSSVKEVCHEIEQVAAGFEKWRSGAALSSFRRIVSGNSAAVVAIADLVGNATSGVFPPATPLLKGFTWILKAADTVKESFDMIEIFFDIMSSFLVRIRLLEGKIPAVDAYKQSVMHVFLSMLGIFNVVAKLQQRGRFREWATDLCRGSNSDLVQAFANLSRNIQRLESATMFATLRQVIETDRKMTDVYEHLTGLTSEVKVLASSTEMIGHTTKEIDRTTKITAHNTKEVKEELQKSRMELQNFEFQHWEVMRQKERAIGFQESNDGNQKSPSVDVRRSSALVRIRKAFSPYTDQSIQLKGMRANQIPGTCSWLCNNELFKKFIGIPEKSTGRSFGAEQYHLLVVGERGMGKSTMSAYVVDKLQEISKTEPRTSVTYFFFREDEEGQRSLRDALQSIVIQLATKDVKYRSQTERELKSARHPVDTWDEETIWVKFIEEKFEKSSVAAMFLVLDGIDEADAEDGKKILRLLSKARENGRNIRAFITSRPIIKHEVNVPLPSILEVNKDMIETDMRHFIKSRRELYPWLSKQMDIWKRIPEKLLEKSEKNAMSMLNSYGNQISNYKRAGITIYRGLHCLPTSLFEMYDDALLRLSKNQSDHALPDEVSEANLQQIMKPEAMNSVVAWLTYSKRTLTLSEAAKLLALTDNDCVFSLEDEVEGRFSKFLKLISQENASTQDYSMFESVLWHSPEYLLQHDTDSSFLELMEEILATRIMVDYQLTLQNRSVRDFFREFSNRSKLKDSRFQLQASYAHRIILKDSSVILQSNEEGADKETEVVRRLQDYAADFWIDHFLAFDWTKEDTEELLSAVSSIWAIATNMNGSLRTIEKLSKTVGIFGESENRAKSLIEAFVNCANALSSRQDLPATPVISWVNQISLDNDVFLQTFATSHVRNWLQHSTSQLEAVLSYKFAYSALILVKSSKETLTAFGDLKSKEAILYVADRHSELSSISQRAVGQVLLFYHYYEEGLQYCERSQQTACSNWEKIQALVSISEAKIYRAKMIKSGDESHNASGDELSNVIGDCQKTTKEALDFLHKEDSENAQVKALTKLAYEQLAYCALFSDNVEYAISLVGNASEYSEDSSAEKELLSSITTALQEKREYKTLVDLVASMVPVEKTHWLGSNTHALNESFQEAAAMSGSDELLESCYKQAITNMDTVSSSRSNRMRLSLASYLFRVKKDLRQSSDLLQDIMENQADEVATYDYTTLNAREVLADVLMEEFRLSESLSEKKKAFELMKKLPYPTNSVSNDFNPYNSSTTIPKALMLRRLGPLNEFQSELCKSFEACIEALTDQIGDNDCMTTRILAKTLACLPGLDIYAQVALGCQFYVLDPKFKYLLSGNEMLEERNVEDVGDVNQYCDVQCDGCEAYYEVPRSGTWYACIICSDCDLCQSCFDVRQKWNCEGKDRGWKTFCGKDHRYIKYPPKNWEGVKDGLIRYGGKNIQFHDWLKDLQTNWESAWKRFFMADEGLKSILE